MRRYPDDALDAPTPPGGSVRSDTSLRDLLPYFLFTFACYCAAPYLGLSSRDVDPRIAEVWPPGGVGFVLLTVIWFTGRRVIVSTLAAMVLIYTVTAIAMGYPPTLSLWLALTGAAQPLVMAAAYRSQLRHRGWAPESPRDLAALFFAAIGSALVLGLIGGYPTLGAGEPSKVLLWWVLRNSVFCFVGGVTFMVMFYGRRSDVLPTSSWANRVGLLVTSVLCVYGTYYDPSLPLSWLLIIPSVWGGLTLTVRGTAYLVLTVALIAASMTYLPQNQFGYTGLLPAASIVDLLVIASAAFAFLLALMREQRGELIQQLDRKGAESESQRQLLETVFDSMSDGVVVLDDSQVTMYNNAARQLLGRPIPAAPPHSWVDAFDLRAPDGETLDDQGLRDKLVIAEGATHAAGLEVLVGNDGATRIVAIDSTHVGASAQTSRMLLLHDVTAQRARLRELRNFAGMVAHDLRGPLTVMDGWLEVAQDEDLDQDVVGDAVTKARESTKRMRQVIEDWLTYAVVQNGKLRPDAVKLLEVTGEIVESRSSSWDEGADPQYFLDLPHSVEADPGLLRQLLDNLVGNAIKYTPAERSPWVQITSYDDPEPGWVRVEVTDHGVGIPEGEEEKIFQEFHRGSQVGRAAGTGLGLALTRRIVGLHGGEIWARRNAEGGSTFSFTMPEAKATDPVRTDSARTDSARSD
jgi:signal transduction histidine kinase